MTLISAHRCGVGDNRNLENTKEGILAVLDTDVDYVEFDVQLTEDGIMVLHHDPIVFDCGHMVNIRDITYAHLLEIIPDILTYEEALGILSGRAGAHIDFKFTSPSYSVASSTFEAAGTATAHSIMGEGNYVVTSEIDDSIWATTQWAKQMGVDVMAGLSIGKSTKGMGTWDAFMTRQADSNPFWRYRDCGANLVVSNHVLAKNCFHERIGLPLLVWTVNSEEDMRRWMGEAWMITTDYPARALHMPGNGGSVN